jgi:hypothetical protein
MSKVLRSPRPERSRVEESRPEQLVSAFLMPCRDSSTLLAALTPVSRNVPGMTTIACLAISLIQSYPVLGVRAVSFAGL